MASTDRIDNSEPPPSPDATIGTSNVRRRTYLVLFIVVVSIAIGAAGLYVFREPVAKGLTQLYDFIKSLGLGGDFLLLLLIILTCFPPIFGYSILVFMCGFIYGFPHGFLPLATGSMIGALGCFTLSRTLFKEYFNRISLKYRYLLQVNKVIEQKGFWILLCVRLGPWPYSAVNVLAAQTSISAWSFGFASLIALPKFLISIYIGSTLTSLVDAMNSNMEFKNPIALVISAVGITVSIIGAIWFSWVIRREVKKMNQVDEEILLDEGVQK
ncbi:snare associated Golgi protein-domain-containing protein [Paraphysoderma sedebokerense]|nr:snare associated Golgi protein-domain-containing protein [Paraphysoderma sedebokerense]